MNTHFGTAMLMTLMIASVVGYAFGMRFKVYVLIPAILVSLVVVAILGLVLESTISAIIIDAALATTGLQVGYSVAIAVAVMRPRGASAHDGLKKLRCREER